MIFDDGHSHDLTTLTGHPGTYFKFPDVQSGLSDHANVNHRISLLSNY